MMKQLESLQKILTTQREFPLCFLFSCKSILFFAQSTGRCRLLLWLLIQHGNSEPKERHKKKWKINQEFFRYGFFLQMCLFCTWRVCLKLHKSVFLVYNRIYIENFYSPILGMYVCMSMSFFSIKTKTLRFVVIIFVELFLFAFFFIWVCSHLFSSNRVDVYRIRTHIYRHFCLFVFLFVEILSSHCLLF